MKKLLIIIISYTSLVSGGAIAQSNFPMTEGGFMTTSWEIDALTYEDEWNYGYTREGSTTFIDDINGDGVSDLFTLSPLASTNGLSSNGCIQAVDPRNGNIIWEVSGTSYSEYLGEGITFIDDINGDTVSDLYLVSTEYASTNGLYNNGYFKAINGSNGNILWEIHGTSDNERLGEATTFIDDIDGDGVGEILSAVSSASTNGFSQNGYIKVLNSLDGTILWQVHGTSDNEYLGEGITFIDDINNDGLAEMLNASPSASTNGLSSNGCVTAIDPINGTILWKVHGTNDHANLGLAITVIDDINGDTVSDILTSASSASTNGLYYNGCVTAIDPTNGSIILQVHGTSDYERLGEEIAFFEDITSDGVSELYSMSMMEDPYNYQTMIINIKAIDPINGTILWQVAGSSDRPYWYAIAEIAFIGDLNSDGVSDIYHASAYASTNGFYQNGYIKVLDGSDGNILWEIHGTSDYERLGEATTFIDDIDGDGVGEILSAVSSASTNGFSQNGYIKVLNSLDGSILWQVHGTSDNEYLGEGITFIDDINGDAVSDILSLSPYASTNGLSQNGCIRVIDPIHGTILWQVDGTSDNEYLGAGITFIDDINGDAVSDILSPSPHAYTNGLSSNGCIRVIDPIHGTILWQVDGTSDNEHLGEGITFIDDIDGDGVGEILSAASSASTNGFYQNGCIKALNGLDGTIIWQAHGTNDHANLGHEMILHDDITNDGVAELTTKSYGHDVSWTEGMIAIDGSNGNTLWGIDDGIELVLLVPNLDIDNDGNTEWIFVSDDKLCLASTAPQKGMTSSASMLSAGQGGNIFYNLDYPDSCAFYRYSLLFSMTSGSVNIQGLNVPLGYDLWLAQSYSGIYPQPFMYPTGFLDADGDAQAGLSVPQNKMPASMIGTTINFASIVRLAWGEWELSSVSVPLLITP
jgi:hypothetical protein